MVVGDCAASGKRGEGHRWRRRWRRWDVVLGWRGGVAVSCCGLIRLGSWMVLSWVGACWDDDGRAGDAYGVSQVLDLVLKRGDLLAQGILDMLHV